MKKYLLQCREIIIYIVMDFEIVEGDKILIDGCEFEKIKNPAGSEALFCLKDEDQSLWYGFNYSGPHGQPVSLRKIGNGVRTITHIDPTALAEKWRNIQPAPESDPGVTPYYNAAHGYSKEVDDDVLSMGQNVVLKRDKLAAAEKRIKELEDALADLITAPAYPARFRAQILESFGKRFRGADYSLAILGDVLDELKIK